MTASPAWSGCVDAKASEGINTKLSLKAGQKISIIAEGWVKYGKEEYALAVPFGRVKEGLITKADKVLKARFSASGKSYDIGSGVYQWPVPEAGELILIVSDSSHRDNSGAFSVDVYTVADEKKGGVKKAEWKGHVPATSSDWTRTGVSVSKGDTVMLVAAGTAQYDSRGRRFGPDGDSQHPSAQTPDPTFVLPEAVAGKLVIKAGDHLFGIGSGGTGWEVPVDGELSFIFNDTNMASEYANNTGGYDVRLVVFG
ncbi:LecA/PA-IL family lectin [Enterobacter cloacae]|uniref:LecA/PA-IL family lectin n=1 Tax=Enterobacter cloacae TaxID=550 RepID=UPI00101AF415|nr:LecA/PA-IL family lectin [Enterobacter cloacae]QBC03337.1 lectin [Enterobacter cloacae]